MAMPDRNGGALAGVRLIDVPLRSVGATASFCLTAR